MEASFMEFSEEFTSWFIEFSCWLVFCWFKFPSFPPSPVAFPEESEESEEFKPASILFCTGPSAPAKDSLRLFMAFFIPCCCAKEIPVWAIEEPKCNGIDAALIRAYIFPNPELSPASYPVIFSTIFGPSASEKALNRINRQRTMAWDLKGSTLFKYVCMSKKNFMQMVDKRIIKYAFLIQSNVFKIFWELVRLAA